MNKKQLILMSLLGLFTITTAAQETRQTEQPNIIFILTDDQRWDALGHQSLKPLVQGNDQLERDYFISEHLFNHPKISKSEGIRIERFKYLDISIIRNIRNFMSRKVGSLKFYWAGF